MKSKKKKLRNIILINISAFLFMCLCIGMFILYGPIDTFRNWLITTAMTTMNHQYLATIFYSEETINKVLDDNKVIEPDFETDTSLIEFVDYDKNVVTYKNKNDKEILEKDKDNDDYKIIKIKTEKLRGYLIAIYHPEKVKIATSKYIGSYGQMITDIAKNNNALVAMNASGFFDPEYKGNGGAAHGVVIKNGKIVTQFERLQNQGGIIGFTNDNKLVLLKCTGEEALKKGVRDAVEFGPFLIVNGEPSFIRGNGGWGDAPRSAIAQRKDGIVLFLVMDGRDYTNGVLGANMVDMTEILMSYGAYNAANLDGGTSSALVIDGKYVNKPINGSGENRTRPIPNAWILEK